MCTVQAACSCLFCWQSPADHLSRSLNGYQVRLLPLDQQELQQALVRHQVDLLFTNAADYIRLRQKNSLTGALATLALQHHGHSVASLGGVIFARNDRGDINELRDLKGKTLACFSTTGSLGSYPAPAHELLKVGIRLPRDAELLITGTPQDQVVEAVLVGKADAGFVRTGILEGMVAQGRLDLRQIKIINRQDLSGYPFIVSTHLYPEWPMVALPHLPEDVGRRIAAALLLIEPDGPVARKSRISGFTVPADYHVVEDLLRELRLPPFDTAPGFTLRDVLQRYFWQVLLVGIAAIGMLLLALQLGMTNRHLAAARRQAVQLARRAEAASKAKSEFLANMSHEIRTPMNGVVGMAQLLSFTELTAQQQEYLDGLELSCNNLLALLNDILDLSKIEVGKIELEYADFSLRRCIQDVVATQKARIHQKGLQLEIEIQDQVPQVVHGDQLRIKQILLNLLGNAIKFTEKGSITVMAGIVATEGTCLTCRLSVQDTGIGMDSEAQGRIFQPFEQADNSTTRLYGGSGLGLSICRRLAELMGGRIWVESTLAVGSTFTVELPLTVQADSGITSAQQPEVARALPPEKRLKVLVAEDNKLNADTTVAMLKRMGHQAEWVSDGQQALAQWHTALFDCILMDIQMPTMDGRLATAAIRQQQQTIGGHIPIIALTAHALRGDREGFLAEGFDGYLAKPVRVQELAEELQRVTG